MKEVVGINDFMKVTLIDLGMTTKFITMKDGKIAHRQPSKMDNFRGNITFAS